MRAAHREVVAYLRSVGAEDIRTEVGGKHPRVVFTWQGRERYKALAGSPSTPFSGVVAIQEIKRMLGLTEREKRVGRRRRRKAKAPCAAATAPHLSTLPDWHDDLLASLSPDELNLLAWHAWRGFWRDCMHSVGAVSVL